MRCTRGPGFRPVRASAVPLVALCVAFAGCGARSGTDSGSARTLAPRNETVDFRATHAWFRGSMDLTLDASVQQATVAAPSARVWSVMPSVLDELGVEVGTRDGDLAIIGNQQFDPMQLEGRRPSRYFNCGNSPSGAIADRYRVTAYLMVQLDDAPGGGTTVTTVIDAYARQRGVSANSLHCTSKGSLERRMLELIEERVSAP